MSLSRRHFLASGLASAAVWPLLGSVRAAQFDADPFALGVASGSPTAQSVVLWTRLIFADSEPSAADAFSFAPAPQYPPMDVAWEIAEDEGFAHVVQSGIATAREELAHSVHVQVVGLLPERWYFYRFRCGQALSPVGRTRTAPADGADNARFSLALAACQQFEQGWYAAYRDMAGRDLDLVVHLGDYIYEKSYGAQHVRSHGTGAPSLLFEYRDRYALYKSDPDLQAAHAAFPWLFTWDDHEVVDNYGGDASPTDRHAPSFLKRRAAAYQAWYEHMPVPPLAVPDFNDLRIYGNHRFGNLLDITLVDARQYRDPAPEAPQPAELGRYTMLGAEQEAWFDQTMAQGAARWSIIGQPTLLSSRDLELGPGTRFSDDGWDHYRSGRDRLLDSVRKAERSNPLVIGGDLHAWYAADVHAADGALVASEFVTGSITSNPPARAAFEAVMVENPHIRFGDASRHGYSVMRLSPDQARVELIAVSDRKDPDASAAKFQEFAVLDGMPGVNRV
ncbi:alkaline phosphatase D family protein [Devosia sp. XJ19-1]|uniref:Alkaline phosphatase D family protein n=1 Tax=Devosia ureilytica TaxID=2952754 RepID=A0A9Q4AM98_9HYPH|nr:alkaline phosphatase D family protein [Devosia ureilytica]MCP8883105.1 alkaline phosphatase D family protein [Devosia ureilytica]MCP8886527.1 alkaline phosphatase D family protein [Devosia ureilytica]